jgi:hypothetical protein
MKDFGNIMRRGMHLPGVAWGAMLDPSTAEGSLRPIGTFLWAAGGSLAIEVLTIFTAMKGSAGLPTYYEKPVFWFVRMLVAAIAGALAVAEGATHPLLAINIGASAPAILQLLTQPPKLS